ncbi:hypothetical protein HY358_00510 [Candidatus Roizmanbacteria bacterium]|nr:hypothetical protein [Candidatus Roizmanbacteria bacterium]
MKRYFVILFLIFSIFTTTSAVLADPVPDTVPVPGYNCGNLRSDENQNRNARCCYYKEQEFKIPEPGGLLGEPFKLVNTLIHPLLSIFNNIQKEVKVQPCVVGAPSTPGDLANSSCFCEPKKDEDLAALRDLCARVGKGEKGEREECLKCIAGRDEEGKPKIGGVWTGLGCVSSDFSGFVKNTLLSWGIGLAGIFALLCVMYAAFTLQTSRANPEKIKKAQELLTSCIMGLLLIIFSVFILRLIGVTILRIPGFS